MRRVLIIGAGVGVLLIGIAAAKSEHDDGPSVPPRGQVSRTELERELARISAPVVAGNSVEIVNNGRVFDALVEEIEKAEKSVHILLFIWRASAPSDRVVKALLSRAHLGIDCRVVIDPIASPNFDEEVRPLLQTAGCDVRYYKPIKETLKQGEEAIERTHRKIVVIDGDVAITGGFGMWKSWEGDGLSEEHWRDTNARVRGPVVRQLQLAFGETWERVGGSPVDKAQLVPQPKHGDAKAAFVASDAIEGEVSEERQTSGEDLAELLVASAQKRLWIANSYFVPTDRILAVLEAKAKAGVDVRVLAPGPVHDWKTVRNAQRVSYHRLITAGVRIYEYQPSMMHAKTFLIDDDLVSIGSMNLDPLSLKQLEEGQLVVLGDEVLAKKLEADLLADLTHAEERKKEYPGPLELGARAVLWLIGGL